MINSDKVEIGMVGEGVVSAARSRPQETVRVETGQKITKESDEQWMESRWWGLQVKH